jgi:molecular chaperone GrpE
MDINNEVENDFINDFSEEAENIENTDSLELNDSSVDSSETDEEVIVEPNTKEALDDEDDSEDDNSSDEDTEEGDGDKMSIFSKRAAKELKKLKEKIKELEDQRLRQLAEFENFRNRSEKEKSQRFEMGQRDVIEKMLPVKDNFERALINLPEGEESKAFVDGIQLIFKQFDQIFDELGVKPIEAVGTEFNPELHNAVMMVDDEEKESGTVAEELQKGYIFKDQVVRHSMVKVVN